MINTIENIKINRIQRISPSLYRNIKSCSYKFFLSEVFAKKPLLPLSANAYYGIVLHKILEMISKGFIKSEADFFENFNIQIKNIEQKLFDDGYGFLVPLKKSAKDYNLKKILLKDHLKEKTNEKPAISELYKRAKYYSEKALNSKDNLVFGIADLIVENSNYIEIIDFKTGVIFDDMVDDNGEIYTIIKEDYKEQLFLYAQLYFETYGRYPTKLSLIDLYNIKYDLPFSKEQCEKIYAEVIDLINTTNKNIEKGIFTAKTSELNCKYCLYRPKCKYYLQLLKTSDLFNDASGIINNVVKYNNGNVTAYLSNSNNIITVTGLFNDKFNDYSQRINKSVTFFNLRKPNNDQFYIATKTTMIYENE